MLGNYTNLGLKNLQVFFSVNYGHHVLRSYLCTVFGSTEVTKAIIDMEIISL